MIKLVEELLSERKKLYHISKNNNLTELRSSIPADILLNKKGTLENYVTPRICFAGSIEGCILGCYLEQSTFDGLPYLEFSVYEPTDYNILKVKSNRELISDKEVFDAAITGEVWVLNNSIKVTKVGRIRVWNEVTKEVPYKVIYKPEYTARYERLIRIGFMPESGILKGLVYRWKYI